jgi:hypothetical protein
MVLDFSAHETHPAAMLHRPRHVTPLDIPPQRTLTTAKHFCSLGVP